jgi:hypothetical protein
MYSTLDRAKKRAKDLKRVFDDSGFIHPLHLCQGAIAQAGGYRDWNDLEGSIQGSMRIDTEANYRRRLLAALPWPCHAPVRAWLDKEPVFETFAFEGPRFWFRDVYPFVSVSMRLQRRRPLLRPGSGTGQQMRDNLVTDLLLHMHPGVPSYPRLDPVTMALVYDGDLATLFAPRIGHPRFQPEFDRLVAEGVFKWTGRAIHVLPVDPDAMRDEIIEDRTHLAEHWVSDVEHVPEFTGRLREALSAIGVDEAWRVAEAIAQQGSNTHITASGPTLDLLSLLAKERRLDTFSRVIGLFAALYPANLAFLLGRIPGKVHANVLAPATGNDGRRLLAWEQATPDWAEQLKSVVGSPSQFVTTVDAMVEVLSSRAA